MLADASVQMPLIGKPGTPSDIRMQVDFELPDETYVWDDLEDYKMDQFTLDSKKIRDIEEIPKINAILYYFEKKVIIEGKRHADIEDLKDLVHLESIYKKALVDDLNWATEEANAMQNLINFSKLRIAKLSHPCDKEYIRTNLIQTIYPVDLIWKLIQVINRDFGKPHYDKALRIQNSLSEIFLYHHLRSDTRFHNRIATENLNLTDPLMRIKIREMNRNDPMIKQKYLSDNFDIKKFILTLFELYFPNVTWRYIGGDQEMHRWSLEILLYSFELGIWEYEELSDLLNSLYLRIENLVVLEKRSYLDFTTTLTGYPKFVSNMKKYFKICNSLVISTCLHIVMLMNDESFKQRFPFYNSKLNYDQTDDNSENWKSAYFNNHDISNILHKILTKYLLNKEHNIKIEEQGENANAERLIEAKKFKYVSDFLLFITDHENDLFFTSSNNASAAMVEYYIRKHTEEEALADRFRTKFIAHLDQFASCFKTENSQQKLESPLNADLMEFISSLVQRQSNPEKLTALKFTYAFRGIPKILMSILSIILHFELTKPFENLVKVALVTLLKDNQIGQTMVFDEVGLFHFNTGYRKRRSLEAVLFLNEVFESNYHIFYNHRYLCREFLETYDTVRTGDQLLKYVFTPEGRKELRALGVAEDPIEKKWVDEILKQYHDCMAQPPGEDGKKEPTKALTSLFIFYSYSRWVSNLFDTTNQNFQSKYYDLMIQDKLATPFFEVLMPIILNKDFLPKAVDGVSYVFASKLQGGDPITIATLSDRVERGELTESDIRGIIFELAMMTAHLVNKLCKRFYTQAIYEYRFLKYARKILPDTEYMLGLQGGLKYRRIMLEMYNTFAIFPNNHLLAGRKDHFPHEDKKSENLLPTKDKYLEKVHEEIKKEVERIAVLETNKPNSPDSYINDAKEYLFKGLLPVLYKFSSGIYHLYTVSPDLKNELDYTKEISKLLKDNQGVFASLGMKINIDLIESDTAGAMGSLGALFIGSQNQVTPSSSVSSPASGKDSHKKRIRPRSFIEKSTPQLSELRDTLEDLLKSIKNCYRDDSSGEVYDYFLSMEEKCSRRNVLTDPENFDKEQDVDEDIELDTKAGNTLISRFQAAVDIYGLRSAEHGYYRWLMGDYRLKKKQAILKQGEQNIFVRFLDSNEGSAKAVIDFFITLSRQWWYKQKQAENQDKADEANPEGTIPDLVQISDNVPVVSLQEYSILSFVEFLDRVMNHSKNIKESLYQAMMTSDEAAQKEGRSFLSLLFFIMMRFLSLTAYKPFMDSDWRAISYWAKVFLSFFKNLCENNYMPFKKLLGEMKPSVDGTTLSLNRSLFFEVFVYIESTMANTKVINTYRQLVVEERAELYPYFGSVLRFLSECCCGPCRPNQDAIFRFRTDMFANLIRRVIDDIESSHYQMKDCVLDYILALTEGNQETYKYFGNNFTYEELLTTLYKLLKRLFIYSNYSQDRSTFQSLMKKAKEKYDEDQKAALKLKLSLKLLPDNSEKFYDIHGFKQTVDTDFDFDPTRPEVISDPVVDYIKISDYQEIYDTFIQSKTFSNHHIMSAVLKITELIIKISQYNDSFRIYLDNTYRVLIDKYGDQVPITVRNRFPKYERKNVDEDKFPEKYHFFMFVTKVTNNLAVLTSEGEEIEITYPLKPCVFFLTEASREEFMQVVDLDQPTYDLVRDFKKFQIEMEDNLELHRNYPLFYRLSSDDSFTNIKKSVWTIGLGLNVLLVIFYTRSAESVNISTEGNYAIITSAATNAGISFLFLVIWFLSKYSQKAAIAKEQYELDDPLTSQFERFKNTLDIYIYYSMIQQNYPVFFLWHVITNVLGIFLSPFFYTLQLLSIIFISKTTSYVVQSITTHFDQLALTFMLSIFVMYSYSVLSAEIFFDTLAGADATTGTYPFCTTLWDCLIYHIDYGLRNGGGIADSSSTYTPMDPSPQSFVAKFFYNIIFFMLINVISLNIIFGIIIDTFANMRDDNTTRSRY